MAQYLRAHRRRSGMTLESLATATGLTKSYLSKVERGLSTPSIAVALKIADALNTDVSQLFSDRNDTSTLTVERAIDRVVVEGDDAVYDPLAARMVRKTMQPFVVHPSTLDDAEFKEHPGEELIYVQSGTVEVTIPGEVIVLTEGDSLYFDASTPHRVRSTSEPRAVLLVVVHDQYGADASTAPSSRCGPHESRG